MFTAMLLIITKKWKQVKCLSTNEWMNKIWCAHNGILFDHKRLKYCYKLQSG